MQQKVEKMLEQPESTEFFLDLTTADLVITIAVLLGPILAVLITRWLDHQREDKARKLEVFKTLMRTRRNPISPEHVGALNLVELEFAAQKNVLKNLSELFSHLGTEHARRHEEQLSKEMDDAEARNRNEKFGIRLQNERQELLAILLHSIANKLGYKIEQLEVLKGGYTPQGWADVEAEQRIIRKYFLDLYTGVRMVPVGVVDYRRPEPLADSSSQPNSTPQHDT